jgi:hypothetical protein
MNNNLIYGIIIVILLYCIYYITSCNKDGFQVSSQRSKEEEIEIELEMEIQELEREIQEKQEKQEKQKISASRELRDDSEYCNYDILNDQNCVENDIDRIDNVYSLNECKEHCDENSNCRAFSWNRESDMTNTCWLKSECNNLKNNKGVDTAKYIGGGILKQDNVKKGMNLDDESAKEPPDLIWVNDLKFYNPTRCETIDDYSIKHIRTVHYRNSYDFNPIANLPVSIDSTSYWAPPAYSREWVEFLLRKNVKVSIGITVLAIDEEIWETKWQLEQLLKDIKRWSTEPEQIQKNIYCINFGNEPMHQLTTEKVIEALKYAQNLKKREPLLKEIPFSSVITYQAYFGGGADIIEFGRDWDDSTSIDKYKLSDFGNKVIRYIDILSLNAYSFYNCAMLAYSKGEGYNCYDPNQGHLPLNQRTLLHDVVGFNNNFSNINHDYLGVNVIFGITLLHHLIESEMEKDNGVNIDLKKTSITETGWAREFKDWEAVDPYANEINAKFFYDSFMKFDERETTITLGDGTTYTTNTPNVIHYFSFNDSYDFEPSTQSLSFQYFGLDNLLLTDTQLQQKNNTTNILDKIENLSRGKQGENTEIDNNKNLQDQIKNMNRTLNCYQETIQDMEEWTAGNPPDTPTLLNKLALCPNVNLSNLTVNNNVCTFKSIRSLSDGMDISNEIYDYGKIYDTSHPYYKRATGQKEYIREFGEIIYDTNRNANPTGNLYYQGSNKNQLTDYKYMCDEVSIDGIDINELKISPNCEEISDPCYIIQNNSDLLSDKTDKFYKGKCIKSKDICNILGGDDCSKNPYCEIKDSEITGNYKCHDNTIKKMEIYSTKNEEVTEFITRATEKCKLYCKDDPDCNIYNLDTKLSEESTEYKSISCEFKDTCDYIEKDTTYNSGEIYSCGSKMFQCEGTISNNNCSNIKSSYECNSSYYANDTDSKSYQCKWGKNSSINKWECKKEETECISDRKLVNNLSHSADSILIQSNIRYKLSSMNEKENIRYNDFPSQYLDLNQIDYEKSYLVFTEDIYECLQETDIREEKEIDGLESGSKIKKIISDNGNVHIKIENILDYSLSYDSNIIDTDTTQGQKEWWKHGFPWLFDGEKSNWHINPGIPVFLWIEIPKKTQINVSDINAKCKDIEIDEECNNSYKLSNINSENDQNEVTVSKGDYIYDCYYAGLREGCKQSIKNSNLYKQNECPIYHSSNLKDSDDGKLCLDGDDDINDREICENTYFTTDNYNYNCKWSYDNKCLAKDCKRCNGTDNVPKNLPELSCRITDMSQESQQESPQESCDGYNTLENTNCNGNDIDEISNVSTYGECCNQCNSNQECNAFTWNRYSDKSCLLKNSCADMSSDDNVSSGINVSTDCANRINCNNHGVGYRDNIKGNCACLCDSKWTGVNCDNEAKYICSNSKCVKSDSIFAKELKICQTDCKVKPDILYCGGSGPGPNSSPSDCNSNREDVYCIWDNPKECPTGYNPIEYEDSGCNFNTTVRACQKN